jgi:hypothetical protein
MKYANNDMCGTIERYAKRKGFPEIRCYVVTLENSVKEYAICDNTEWLYGSQSAEAIAVHIDMMELTRS